MALHLKQKLLRLRASWYVWLFPLVALAISAWLFKEYLNQQGPTIRISFDDAANIREEKTRLRYRGVTIGTVKKLELSEDRSHVVVTAVLYKNARNFAVEGTKFWVVTPKVGVEGVRALETLFEGPYISATPGSLKGKYKTAFKGQTEAELQKPVDDTTSYVLETGFVESISVGDPVSFRGINVGTVTKVSLSKTAQSVLVQINIQNTYTRLIRTNTVFWKKVAVQAHLGLFKSEIKVSALESLLKGGIDFFTPDPPGPVAKARTRFPLSAEPPKDWDKWNPSLEKISAL